MTECFGCHEETFVVGLELYPDVVFCESCTARLWAAIDDCRTTVRSESYMYHRQHQGTDPDAHAVRVEDL